MKTYDRFSRHNYYDLISRAHYGDRCKCVKSNWICKKFVAFNECKICSGYGTMPIPWRDLEDV
jgi:hypothetical protein